VTSALMQQLLANGRSIKRLLAEVYLFPEEREHSPLHNASEYATLLNACGRWARPQIGHSVCMGDRGGALREAEHMLTHHRTVIRELLQFIIDNGVTELSHLQYLHVGERFPDTIVGIGAGMALSKLNREKPILIMCRLPEDPAVTKVSMRTVDEVVGRGVDLQAALVHASHACGGEAGGHRIAARRLHPRNSRTGVCHSCQPNPLRAVPCGVSGPSLTTSSDGEPEPDSSRKPVPSPAPPPAASARSTFPECAWPPCGHRTGGSRCLSREPAASMPPSPSPPTG
jgi:Single-stranded DNA-specific exonuclease